MILKNILMSAAAAVALAACTPAAETPAPEIAAPADIAAPAPESGPAAENTTDTLASAPPADATPPAAPETTTPAAAPPAAPAAAAGLTKAELTNGAAVYARTCAMCHGPTGAGTQMGVGLTAGHEYAVIKEKVTKGQVNPGDKMPALAASMSASDLSDVAHFVEAGLPQ